MGGLVIRAYLNKYKVLNLDKVILVATPNKGSEVADFFRNNKLFKKLFGPAGQQLTTNQQELIQKLGKLYYECGIISCNLPLDPCAIFMLGKANDGKVTVESTKVEEMSDHIVISIPHWYITKSKKVKNHIFNFLLTT